ncbi:DUF3885 domain-containing protein [Fictibacillus aquaticus]
MKENFPSLQLRQPLFYNWKNAIRFELGVVELRDYERDSLYLENVYNRAVTIFKALHSNNGDIFVVANVSDYGYGITPKHKINIFSKYVKKKSVLSKLTQTTIPYVYPEDDDEGDCKTHRFTLRCKPSDIKFQSMIRAICNQDIGVRPTIPHEIYFININSKTIFSVYDDRGCDLVGSCVDSIRNIYKEYNDWILDYDRNEIDKIFR